MPRSVCFFSPPAVSLLLLLVLSNCPSARSNRALLVIDVQNCFLGTGSLAVKDGEDIIPVINKIRRDHGQQFSLVVFTQDWHCVNHVSFASSHPNHAVYQTINLTYLNTGQLCKSEATRADYTVDCSTTPANKTVVVKQELWPDHCIQNTADAGLYKDLIQEGTDLVIRKGQHCQVDSYSGFFDNGNFTQTDLHEELSKRGIQTVFLVGLALDYCLSHTAQDARELGYETYVVLDATEVIDKSIKEAASKRLTDIGVVLIQSSDLGSILASAAPSRSEPQFAALICIFLINLL